MRTIVVGAFGLIGSAVVEAASQHGHSVISIDIGPPDFAEPWKARATALRTDMVEKISSNTYVFDPGKDQIRFAGIVESFSPTAIVNCGGNSLASEFSTPESILEETMTRLNQVLLERCLYAQARYIYISSSMVYGNFAEVPLQESSTKNPIDPYGALKLGCEHLIRAFAHQHEFFDFAILRPAAVYGALDSNSRALVKMLHTIDEEGVLFVRTLAEELDFTPVASLAEMIVRVLGHPGKIRSTYNTSNGNAASMAEVVGAFRQLLSTIEIPVHVGEEIENDILRPKRGTLSMDLFRSDFGSVSSVEILGGLRALIDDSRNHDLLEGRLRIIE